MKPANNQLGVATIELAILLTLLISIIIGISEFGRAILQYNTITKVTRDAARYLSEQQPDTTTMTDNAVAICLVKYGQYDNCVANPGSVTGPLLVPGLASATINTSLIQVTSPQQLSLVKVNVSNYQFTSLLRFISNNLATITYGNISTTMRTQQ